MKLPFQILEGFPDILYNFESIEANAIWDDTVLGGDLTGNLPNPTIAPLDGSTWVTISSFSNSWVAGANPPQYLKDPLGFVHLRGSISSGTSGALAFTLPAGFRPGITDNYPVLQSAGAAGAFLAISTAGAVTPTRTGSGVFLNGLTFLAEN